MRIQNGIVVAVVVLTAGCYGYGRAGFSAPTAEIRVEAPPPPPRAEVVIVSPGPGYVWVGGYSHWDGSAYAWVDGTWQYAEPGYVWVRPRYVRRSSGWVYYQGYFNSARTHRRVYDAREFHSPPAHGHGDHQDRGRHVGRGNGR